MPDCLKALPGVRHAVVCRLKHAAGSAEEQDFLQSIQRQADIASVRRFGCLRQVSPKNKFRFGVSMAFDSAQGCESYKRHPDHIRFVPSRWIPERADFMAIDCTAL